MCPTFSGRLSKALVAWFVRDRAPDFDSGSLYDFDRLRYEVRPADVLLVEGSSRVAEVIKLITQSPWTHSALYVGRLYDIDDPAARERILASYPGDPEEQLVVEALLGDGTIVSPLAKYRGRHLRICRPKGLARADAQRVIGFAVRRLGNGYDLRHLLDLARFLFPYGVLPRRWRSTLFEYDVGEPTRTLCCSMLAEAFNAVHFPILPFIERCDDGSVRLYKRNPRLVTPKDFDTSPYFDIVKYPFLGLDDLPLYRQLPWNTDGLVCNAPGDCYLVQSEWPPDAEVPGSGRSRPMEDDLMGDSPGDIT
jgi:hypothetical protein